MKGQSSILLLVFCACTGSLAKPPPPTFLEYKDSLGQYSFGYSAPESARSEVRSIDGSTRGSYSYVDDSGIIQSAQYTADGKNGFQVIATNLPQAPQPVQETPEVLAARIDHLKALEAATLQNPADKQPEDAGSTILMDPGKSGDSEVIEAIEPEDKNDPMEEKKEMKDNDDGLIVKSGSMENQNILAKDQDQKLSKENQPMGALLKKSDGVLADEPIKPEAKTAVTSGSEVPVVTTSFVVPGSVNFHSRIELDRSSGAGAARISTGPLPLSIQQPLMPQAGSEFLTTPAATKMRTMTDSEKMEILEAMKPLPGAPSKTTGPSEPQEFLSAVVPGVVAPSSVFAFTYGIGVDPFYRQYNPFHYYPYGIL